MKCNMQRVLRRLASQNGERPQTLNRVRSILKTGPTATPFEAEDLGKAALNDFKKFASNCRSRGLNLQGWGYFGDLKQQLNSWEAKASRGRKLAAKARCEDWQTWAEEACLGGAKAGPAQVESLYRQRRAQRRRVGQDM